MPADNLPPEVSKDAVGNALANAAKAAQKPYGAVYASSSEREGSTLEHALENYKKDVHSGLLKTAGRLGVTYPAIGTWSDGAEESSITETDPDEVDKVGAIIGLKHRQKGVAVFRPDDKGMDAQHVLGFDNPVPLEKIQKMLASQGVDFATFMPYDHAPGLIDGVHVLSQGPENTEDTKQRLMAVTNSLKGQQFINHGHVNIHSAPTREAAAKLFKALLRKTAAPEQPEQMSRRHNHWVAR